MELLCFDTNLSDFRYLSGSSIQLQSEILLYADIHQIELKLVQWRRNLFKCQQKVNNTKWDVGIDYCIHSYIATVGGSIKNAIIQKTLLSVRNQF